MIVHSPDVREPQPLSIHHLPFAITFALFGVSGLCSCVCVCEGGV